MNMQQKQLTLTELQTPITTEKKINLNPEIITNKVIEFFCSIDRLFLFKEFYKLS
jgi:hypothetical protein